MDRNRWANVIGQVFCHCCREVSRCRSSFSPELGFFPYDVPLNCRSFGYSLKMFYPSFWYRPQWFWVLRDIHNSAFAWSVFEQHSQTRCFFDDSIAAAVRSISFFFVDLSDFILGFVVLKFPRKPFPHPGSQFLVLLASGRKVSRSQ